VVELAGAVPSNGLADGDLNRRFKIEATPTANSYTVTTGANATAALAIGGATVHAAYRTFRDNPTTFSFPRSSTFDCVVWSNRATVLEDTDPFTRSTRPNVAEGATITRRTAPAGGSPPAGIECRAGYDTKRRGAGSTVVQFAFVADVLPRDDSRILTLWDGDTRPSGWGYLDIAEKYDLEPLNVLAWRDVYVEADGLFTDTLQGYAISHNVTILQNGRMSNVPNIAAAKKGVMLDLEHGDYRAPERLHAGEYPADSTDEQFSRPQPDCRDPRQSGGDDRIPSATGRHDARAGRHRGDTVGQVRHGVHARRRAKPSAARPVHGGRRIHRGERHQDGPG
jgi:hypothetical protein